MNLTAIVIVWAAFGIATLVLAVYRHFLSTHQEANLVHLGPGEEAEIPKQFVLAHRMQVIDRWGKILTVLIAVIGLGLAAAYLYQAWLNSSLQLR